MLYTEKLVKNINVKILLVNDMILVCRKYSCTAVLLALKCREIFIWFLKSISNSFRKTIFSGLKVIKGPLNIFCKILYVKVNV